MKRLLVLFLICISVFALAACGENSSKSSSDDLLSDTEKVEVGEKNSVAYFKYSDTIPEIVLKGENETVIKSEAFFKVLAVLINGKNIIKDVCNCEALYVIQIDEYTLGLHVHSISIYSGDSVNAVNLIGTLECTEEEMNELFEVLKTLS